MSWPSDLYITLLTDLLSPGNLPRGTLASIAHHVGTLEDAGLSRLLSAMLQSPTLFGQDELQEASTSTHVSYLSPQATQDAFHAIRQGIVMRLQAAKKSKGSGWSKRRKLSKTLDTFYGVVSIPHSGKDWADSFKRSALVTGVLRGMQDAITEKDALITTDSSLIHTAERHVIKSLSNTVSLLPKVKATELPDGES